MVWSKLVVPTDFSDYSRLAIDYAAKLVQGTDQHVTLVHCVRPTDYPLGQVMRSRGFPNFADEVRKNCMRQLEDLAVNFPAGTVDFVVREGNPIGEIAELADELDADLIVMSTHGRSGWKKLILGATAAGLGRVSLRPVLSVRERKGDPFDPTRMRKIVVTTDFSKPAGTGIDTAAAVAREFGSELIIVHVAEEPLYLEASIAGGAGVDSFREEAHRAIRSNLDEVAAGCTGVDCRTVVREGTAAAEIAALVAEERADLVVIASRGLSGIKRLALGSTAEKVVAEACCPVLAV